MNTPKIIVEIRDEEPTTEQVVAYDRFWRLVIERLMREREAQKALTEGYPDERLAA